MAMWAQPQQPPQSGQPSTTPEPPQRPGGGSSSSVFGGFFGRGAAGAPSSQRPTDDRDAMYRGSYTPPTGGTSPVSSNGRITPSPAPPTWYTQWQAAQQPPATTATTAATTAATGTAAATTPTPAAAAAPTPPVPSAPKPADMPGLRWVPTQDGQGWVPDNHPAAWRPPAASATPTTPTPATNPNALPTPSIPYGGAAYTNPTAGAPTTSSVIAPAAPVAAPPPPQNIFDFFTQAQRQLGPASQFTQNQPFTTQQNALMQGILLNPHTMNADVVQALREKQKETALAFQNQFSGQLAQSVAGRGFSTAGGQNLGLQNQLAGQTQQNILGAYRDIALKKAAQDRADELQAIQSAQELQTGQQANALDAFNANLNSRNALNQTAGALAQNAATTDSANWQAFLQHQGDIYGTQAGLYGNQLGYLTDAQRNQITDALGRLGIGVDQARLAQQGSQFDRSFGLDFLNYLEGRRQFDQSLGLDRSRLGQQWDMFANEMAGNQQNNFFNFMRALGF